MMLETFRNLSTRPRTPSGAREPAGVGVFCVGGGCTTALSGWVAARSGLNASVGAVSTCAIGFPHCAQKIACWRTDTPQAVQRRAISGLDISASCILYPVHCVE